MSPSKALELPHAPESPGLAATAAPVNEGPLEDAPPPVPGLEELRARSRGAFEGLVAEYQHRVYDFCVRMLADRDEAFDLVQDIFVSVHQSLPGFRADASVTTWIFRIAKNHCLNRLKYLRRRRGDARPDVTEAMDQVPDLAPGPDHALVAEAERRLLARAIASLEEEQRLLVTLRDIEGLSYEEIVVITELPIGTVKSRLHRAREKLAVLLAPETR